MAKANPAVEKVRKALKAAGLDDKVTALKAPLTQTAAAAKELGAEAGQILQALIYFIGKRMVLVLIAGDHAVIESNLGAAFFMQGEVRKPSAAELKGATGFTAGAVPPVALPGKLPAVIDHSLKRFRHVYAAAGDAGHAFRIGVPELMKLTQGIVSYNVAKPLEGVVVAPPPLKRTKTFTGERKLPG
ncbi:MAG: YbaK/EbsC family protein [Rhodospirillales bacterium]|nr:YbaK/EbsC family protein [Rhodospirillales bacterium]